MNVLVLDAMGVIYSVGDDVKDLLTPFILEMGGTKDISKIERLYHLASLGNIAAYEFWDAVGLDPRIEDEYLKRHKLTDGLIDFLEIVKSRRYEVWCLSNDLSEWSQKLRASFGLDDYLQGFVISGDVGFRKPDPAIYQYLIGQVNVKPSDMVFVDDGVKNLDTALKLGFNTILYSPLNSNLTNAKHQIVRSLRELLVLLPAPQ